MEKARQLALKLKNFVIGWIKTFQYDNTNERKLKNIFGSLCETIRSGSNKGSSSEIAEFEAEKQMTSVELHKNNWLLHNPSWQPLKTPCIQRTAIHAWKSSY
jgi:hypothetical protein